MSISSSNGEKSFPNHQDIRLEDFLEKLQQIIDFKIQNGGRTYRTKWIADNGKSSLRWLPLQQMRPYLNEVLHYELKHKKKVQTAETEWNQAYSDGFVKKKLQTLNIGRLKKLMERKRKGAAKEPSDSSFEREGAEEKKKQISKRKKNANQPLPKKYKQPAGEAVTRPTHQNSIEANHQTVTSTLPKKHENRINLTQILREMRQCKLTHQLPNEQFDLPTHQAANHQPHQQPILSKEAIDADSEMSSPAITPYRHALTDQSDNASSHSEEFQQALLNDSNSVSEIPNPHKIREYIESSLRQISKNEKNCRTKLEPSFEEEAEAEVEGEDKPPKLQSNSINEELKLEPSQCKIEPPQSGKNCHSVRQQSVGFLQVINDNFQKKLKQIRSAQTYQLPQCFQRHISSKLITGDELRLGQVKINNIISLYNLNNFCVFAVNIGNNYYEEQRFIEYTLMKSKYLSLLTEWLKIAH